MMPAESGMIRRLREWQYEERKKQNELNYWRVKAAQACQQSVQTLFGGASQMQANAELTACQANSARACTELEILKLAALGSRISGKPSSLFDRGSPWG